MCICIVYVDCIVYTLREREHGYTVCIHNKVCDLQVYIAIYHKMLFTNIHMTYIFTSLITYINVQVNVRQGLGALLLGAEG